jgi:hypothetical protein
VCIRDEADGDLAQRTKSPTRSSFPCSVDATRVLIPKW